MNRRKFIVVAGMAAAASVTAMVLPLAATTRTPEVVSWGKGNWMDVWPDENKQRRIVLKWYAVVYFPNRPQHQTLVQLSVPCICTAAESTPALRASLEAEGFKAMKHLLDAKRIRFDPSRKTSLTPEMYRAAGLRVPPDKQIAWPTGLMHRFGVK